MHNSKQYIHIPRTILITLIVISLAHILLASEDKNDENNTKQQNYGRKTRRLMRPFSKSDTRSDHVVSKGLLSFAFLKFIIAYKCLLFALSWIILCILILLG